MISPRRIRLAALLFAGLVTPIEAQDPPPTLPKAGLGRKSITLTVSPRPAEVPAFRHRLFPLESERTPGDAAPIYLRLHGEFRDQMRLLQGEKPSEWLELPMAQFPTAEAREFVNKFAARIEQIQYGTRRRSCDWNYTLPEEREHSFEILLPDVQEMRQWGRLLALKARVEIAEGKQDEAIRTMETGLGFARHVGEGPFLINGLVGVAIATTILQQLDELIGRPDAPNLYWALTALPRPLIDLRAEFETEVKLIDWAIPELGEVDRPRSESEWSSLLARAHGKLVGFWERPGVIDADLKRTIRFEVDLARFRSALLPAARERLKGGARPMDGISDDQALMLHLAGLQREICDESSRPFYVPIAEAAPLHVEVARRRATSKEGPAALFVALAPNVEATQAADARLGRKIAILRAVEAIRMQAAADGGKVPDSLAKVTVVPVPVDPATGRAFEYRRDGDQVELSSAAFHEGRLVYQIGFRK